MFYYNILAPQLKENPNLSIQESIDPRMMRMFSMRTTFGLTIEELRVLDLEET